MPLLPPNLDDKTFESLVTEATKVIPRRAPEWTNHNRHDPGITLIELFAWLAEMQQYYLNRIGEANYLKFLKLLGAVPRPASQASGAVSFSFRPDVEPPPQGVLIPAGTRLAAGDVVFETTEPLRVFPGALAQVFTFASSGVVDNTDANNIDRLAFYAFGEEAEAGSSLYLGFSEAFPVGERIAINFVLVEDYPVTRGSHDDEAPDITPSAALAWEYFTRDRTWAPLAIGDGTLELSQSGAITFDVPPDMEPRILHPSRQSLFWLRARAVRAGYELAPRVDAILLNTVPIVQADTLSQVLSFDGTGQPGQTIVATTHQALHGSRLLQVQEPSGYWRDWQQEYDLAHSGPNDRHYTLVEDLASGRITLAFGDGEQGAIPPAGTGNIRLIARVPELAPQFMLGPSNGLPGQDFTLSFVPVAPSGLQVQVARQVRPAQANRVTKDVSCLLSFERAVQAPADEGEPYTVTLILQVVHALARIEITEAFHGDLNPVEGDSTAFAQDDPVAGQRLEYTYRFTPGDRGGSIGGSISLYPEPRCPPIVDSAPRSIVEVGAAATGLAWQDWQRVADFDASTPGDPHYLLCESDGAIRFGDGINGDVPPVPAGDERNIRLVAYATSVTDKGNLPAGAIVRILQPGPDPDVLAVSNRYPVTGGRVAETLEQAQARVRAALKVPSRTVTSDDFEYLARATPGLRVARAKAIPLYAPELEGYPQEQAPASVTVVVVPYSLSPQPTPSQGFLDTVCRHLDRHRLLTTQLYVVGPAYICVAARVTVGLVVGASRESTLAAVQKALARFLHPLHGGPEGAGWPFGRTVYRSEVYECVEKVPGVDCVEALSLSAEGEGATREPGGDIHIPPYSLVYSGNHQVDALLPGRGCRPKGA